MFLFLSGRLGERIGTTKEYPKPTEKTKITAGTIPDRLRLGSITTTLTTDKHQVGGDKSTTEVRNTYKLPFEKVTIGTCNVHTLYSCGKMIELE